MSNLVGDREVILVPVYDLYRLLAPFRTFFQTARTLYFLRTGCHYSKRGAHSWRGDTSIIYYILTVCILELLIKKNENNYEKVK